MKYLYTQNIPNSDTCLHASEENRTRTIASVTGLKAWFTLAILSAILCFLLMQMSELAHKSIESLFTVYFSVSHSIRKGRTIRKVMGGGGGGEGKNKNRAEKTEKKICAPKKF